MAKDIQVEKVEKVCPPDALGVSYLFSTSHALVFPSMYSLRLNLKTQDVLSVRCQLGVELGRFGPCSRTSSRKSLGWAQRPGLEMCLECGMTGEALQRYVFVNG
jgi:hypothetical protein